MCDMGGPRLSRPPGWEREGRAYLCDTGGPRLSRPPACPWRPRGRLRVHGAPGTSRPTMCADMAWSVVGADVLGRPRVRGVPVGAFAYTARRGRRALPCATREGRACRGRPDGNGRAAPTCATREGRACRGRLVGVRLWNADASHTQFWQRPMWLRRPEYRATPQSVFAKVQGREPARRRERGRGGRPRPPAATAVTRAALPHPLRARKNAVQIFEQSAGRRLVK